MAELDSLRFGRLNQEFHGLIYEHCPNTALVGMLRDVARRLDAIRRTVFVQIPYRGAASVAEHRELIELIASRRAGGEDREGRARAQAQHRSQLPRAAGRARRAEDGIDAARPRSRS